MKLRELAKEIDALALAALAEPDYEALQHEREHNEGADMADVRRETTEEKQEREAVLLRLAQRLSSVRQMLGLREQDDQLE